MINQDNDNFFKNLDSTKCCVYNPKLHEPQGSEKSSEHSTICQDIEDLFTPIEKYKHHGKISVTELSAQVWCELQLDFALKTGRKRTTQAMADGIARHAVLEAEDHDVEEIEVQTKEEVMCLKLLSSCALIAQLLRRGRAREVWIVGTIDGIIIRGIIDELRVEVSSTLENDQDVKRLVILDTKTRRKPTEPSMAQKRTTAMQLQAYHFMIRRLQDQKFDTDLFSAAYELDMKAELKGEIFEKFGTTTAKDAVDLFMCMSSRLPKLASYAEVSYDYNGQEFARSKIPCSDEAAEYIISDLLDWWRGNRPTECVRVSEQWKCKSCDFLDICDRSPLDEDTKQQILDFRDIEEIAESVDFRTVPPLSPSEDVANKANGIPMSSSQ